MSLSENTKTSIAFKKAINMDHRNTSNEWYEETPGGGFNSNINNLWFETIQSTPPTLSDRIIKCYVDGIDGALKLTQDTSVSDSRGWKAEVGGNRIRGWIPPKYGQGYTVKLYQDNGAGTAKGAQIYTTDAMDWFFDYETGYLSIQDTHAYTTPFWIEAYTYTGDVGATGVYNLAGLKAGTLWNIVKDPYPDIWSGIAYGNGIFVAVSGQWLGTDNNIKTSPDGINWTLRNIPGGYYFPVIMFHRGLFITPAADSNKLMTSPDGINWTIRTVPYTSNWSSMCYGNGVYVISSNEYILYSYDLLNWVSSYALTDYGAVCFGNGLFVFVTQSDTGDSVLTSPDGINWTIRNVGNTLSWIHVTYGNGVYVASNFEYSDKTLMVSSDGINWSLVYLPEDHMWAGEIYYGNGLFVITTAPLMVQNIKVATSSDGYHWKIAATFSEDDIIYSTCYGNGRFIAVGSHYYLISGDIQSNYISPDHDHISIDNFNDYGESSIITGITGTYTLNIDNYTVDRLAWVNWYLSGYVKGSTNEITIQLPYTLIDAVSGIGMTQYIQVTSAGSQIPAETVLPYNSNILSIYRVDSVEWAANTLIARGTLIYKIKE